MPWLLSIGGLVWNYINFRLTTKLQRKIRSGTVRLDEFKRIRATIDTVAADLGSSRDTLRSLARSGTDRAGLQSQIEASQKQVLEIYFRLESALTRADASDFAGGNDWLSPVESHWEIYLASIDKAYGPHRSDDEVRAVPAEAAMKLTALIAAVESRIEQEMKQFATGP